MRSILISDFKLWKALLRTSLSTSNETLLRKLSQRKHREKEGLFLAEGLRCISELINNGMKPRFLVFAEDFPESAYQEYPSFSLAKKTFSELSRHQTNQGCLGVFEIPSPTKLPEEGKILVLDAIQDPGNLGTIIRTAVWFGVDHVVLGTGCVDVFNSKTVSATSGAIASMKYSKSDLADILKTYPVDSVFGLSLNGSAQTLRSVVPPESWMLIMGNEGNGINPEFNGLFTPVFVEGKGGVESLNVAATAAISLYHFANF